MVDCALDLDLSGLKHLKNLDVWTPGLTLSADKQSSLTNLAFLCWYTPGVSPCLNDIERLTNLQHLRIEECKAVQVLDVTDLKLLRLAYFSGFPDSQLANLQVQIIEEGQSLQECPGLGELYSLETLELSGCGMMQELACLGRLTNLRVLSIPKCKSTRAVPGLNNLVALEELQAWECLELSVMPGMVKLTNLRKLDIRQCPVQGVPGLNGLIALTEHSLGRVEKGDEISRLWSTKPIEGLRHMSSANDWGIEMYA